MANLVWRGIHGRQKYRFFYALLRPSGEEPSFPSHCEESFRRLRYSNAKKVVT